MLQKSPLYSGDLKSSHCLSSEVSISVSAVPEQIIALLMSTSSLRQGSCMVNSKAIEDVATVSKRVSQALVPQKMWRQRSKRQWMLRKRFSLSSISHLPSARPVLRPGCPISTGGSVRRRRPSHYVPPVACHRSSSGQAFWWPKSSTSS